jgi:hypothetical protein
MSLTSLFVMFRIVKRFAQLSMCLHGLLGNALHCRLLLTEAQCKSAQWSMLPTLSAFHVDLLDAVARRLCWCPLLYAGVYHFMLVSTTLYKESFSTSQNARVCKIARMMKQADDSMIAS